MEEIIFQNAFLDELEKIAGNPLGRPTKIVKMMITDVLGEVFPKLTPKERMTIYHGLRASGLSWPVRKSIRPALELKKRFQKGLLMKSYYKERAERARRAASMIKRRKW